MFAIRVSRLSGVTDVLRIQTPEELTKAFEMNIDMPLTIGGHLRSFNNKSGVGSRLVLSVLAREMHPGHDGHANVLALTGTLCKTPTYRKTPLGREICDLLIAVSRGRGRSDYLPCITWGAAARGCAGMKTGDRVSLKGRLQSREYTKLENGIETMKTAFEISVSEINLM
jgi:primosomal replication protein N